MVPFIMSDLPHEERLHEAQHGRGLSHDGVEPEQGVADDKHHRNPDHEHAIPVGVPEIGIES